MDCPSCGTSNPPQARFCLNCGTALASAAIEQREERKVVSILFADLVGFTARAESLDPEDVEQILRPYHDHLRADIERWGGVVEKFIGDAVMAVFGAPVSHEDDAERAVRAALAIRDWARDQDNLELRVAVNTGEALVSVDARPELGQSMVKGDVVNTAARLQAAAPANGIIVGTATYRATENVIDYEAASPIAAKGKAAPVPVWIAANAHSQFGVDVRQLGRAPLVGRQRELDALTDALNRARSSRKPQLVTLVGAPGMGKSRLLWELFQRLDAEKEIYTWRQGRSLPYGSGVAFWALGEIVKAQAGILESDDPDATSNKLDESLATLISDDAQRHWVSEHLRPLVGIATRDGGQTDRGEAFAAWRRYVEGLAESRTTVLVFEDLHWADDGLLDFVDNLAEWVTDVPLLLVGTARPELLSRRANWGGGKTNALTLSLSPLSDDDTTALVHALFERSVLPAETQHQLIEQAGGNPLYAEEFVRLARQRTGSEPAMPESVQAIIAARIDGLPPEDKRLLQQAAVIGKVFWLGGLTALSGEDRWKVEEALHRLDRRDFVRRERRSSVAAETEFAFRHALVREAAYDQLPRGERAALHRQAATWIESLGRTEDVAEMLAHHYLSAIEYARAVGRPIDDFALAAMSALRAAGDRAQALHSNLAAIRFYESALSLMAPDDPDRAATVFAYGRALQATGDERAVAPLEQASEALGARGERGLAAEAERLLADIGWHAGDRAATDRHIARAQELVAGLGSAPARAAVLSEVSRYHMIAHRLTEAITVGEQAIALSRELRLPVLEAHALNNVGTARLMGGDLAGLAELELSLQLAQSANSPEASRALNNLSVSYWVIGDLERSVDLRIQSIESDRRFDRAVLARFAEAFVIAANYVRGRWDTFLEEFARFKAEQQSASRYAEAPVDADIARILAARGRDDEALALARACADWGRQMKESQAITPTLGGLADVQLTLGMEAEALQTTEELASAIGTTEYLFLLIPLAAAAKSGEMIAVLRSMVPEKHVESGWLTAYLALLEGRHAEAADILDNMGSVPHAALARTEAAERLVRAGQIAEADMLLGQALPFWRSVRAERFIRRAEALLSKTA